MNSNFQAQLEESRKKLRTEIIEHQMLKNCLDKNIKEMDGFKIELDLTRKAVGKLEEENAKYRDSLAKLETQMDVYVTERSLLMDRCHNAEVCVTLYRLTLKILYLGCNNIFAAWNYLKVNFSNKLQYIFGRLRIAS